MELPSRARLVQQRATGTRGGRARLAEQLHEWLDVPVATASVLMILLTIIQLTASLSAQKRAVVGVATTALWAFLVASLAVEFVLAPDRRRFLRRHWPSLIAAVVPFFSFLRVLPALRLLRVGPYVRLLVFGHRTASPVLAILRRRKLGKVGLVSIFVVGIASALEYLVESGSPGANIETLGDALWWAAATATTIGSQLYPVTTAGKIIGFGLMLYSIAIITYFVAALASALVGHDAARPPASKGEVTLRVTPAEAASLRRLLDQLPSPSSE